MIGDVFYWVFNMSVIASFMGLLILPLRAIRPLPRRISVYLWLVPFLRMCVPAGIGSRWSLMSLISRYATRTVVVYSPSDELELSFVNSVQAADNYFPITYSDNILRGVFRTAGIVWIVILSAAVVFIVSQYAAAKKELADARRLYDNVYISGSAPGPAVYGIIRPKIILPAPYADTAHVKGLDHILRHEKAHIRRADNLWRLLALLTAAVHWFNPFSWLFLKLFLSDLELACDESVISGCGAEERKRYAETLLNCAEAHAVFASGFGGSGLRRRIESILSYKRVTLFAALCLALLVAAMIFALVSNAV